MPRKSNLAKSKCALCGAKDVSEPRGDELYCRDCWEKKIAVEEIVAREFALPAVVATGNGTSSLVDGEEVTVDGARGTVTRG